MTNVTPIQQPVVESLRNALQIAWAWRDRTSTDAEAAPFNSVARLIRDALAKLSEPNAAMIAATERALAYHHPSSTREPGEDYARYIRDTAALLLNAQIRGAL